MTDDRAVDVLIFSIGYETRARYVPSIVAYRRGIAIEYDRFQIHAFEENRVFAKNAGVEIIKEVSFWDNSSAFRSLIRGIIENAAADCIIGIDISSMPRRIIAQILRDLRELREPDKEIYLKLIYAPAKFVPPPTESGPFLDFAPLPGFEGWTCYPERPIALVIGLGFEADHALGAYEYLDPSGTWAFIARGVDVRFLDGVERTNRQLLQMIPPEHCVYYEITAPYQTYVAIRGLCEVLSLESRVVIVPVGPKMFCALSLLVAAELGGELAVWRASMHEHSDPPDVKAAGSVVEFTTRIEFKLA